MDIIELMIVLVIGVAISSIISHFVPAVPISLFQIVIGFLLATIGGTYIEVDSHWFMMLFVAPILFNDAWRFPKRELWKLRVPILMNAIWLVLVTTILGGWLIHFLIPELPIAASLALAAVLSPTDPIAVQAIAKRVKLPENLLHVVTGESLVNDATGLVSFNTAIKAVVAGTFLLTDALLNFAWMTMAGIVTGVIIGALIIWLRDSVSRFGLADVVFYTVITILLPFIIYWVAEYPMHASGLIAVVTGGITAKILNDRHVGLLSAEATIVSVHAWEVLVYVLNGLIFVLLGVTLPNALHNILEDTNISNLQALAYGLLVWFIIFSLRVLWALAIQIGQRLRHKAKVVSFKSAIVSGLTGVRGAVTMAAVLTIPVVTYKGELFIGRDLMIFIAAVVVIFSLVVASVMLPVVTKQTTKHDFTQPEGATEVDDDLPEEHRADLSEDQARLWIMRVGIQALRDVQNNQNRRIVHELITRRQKKVRQLRRKLHEDEDQHDFAAEKDLELQEVALKAERNRLQQLLVDEEITPITYSLQDRRLDQIEADLGTTRDFFANKRLKWLLRRLAVKVRIWLAEEENDRVQEEADHATRELLKAAIAAISAYVEKQVGDTVMQRVLRQEAYNLIVIYRFQIEKTKAVSTFDQQEEDDRMRLELELKALNAERDFTQQLYEQKRISRQTSINLRQVINYAETRVLVGRNEE
ncbi:sodium:proton antiporter [Fructobacillus evanidus]|uniref:NhaP-type Na+/H+ or K+/H+ antiporter (NhaP) n=1 Tax=Fructobacillus evanidus TaxID=3064281 RepID=A0ABM9N179_9LACO|nr:NhaP-type Na+/H+ or K+/H+ antiporter (NhaP) [Fructobacillus sp. LMG 32999]CAK1248168.1 NhaP-type Na+/H+ or K+/H+ antiporter (NhaP) [Fructobacillus sp. LMG 32999]CAK1252533.1 NhaP-type Na+/H+ or K+/H+ antiporter (NhaP) [Fructobacillus sp. LMG 32999]CAK1252564.1 NhaP-type Na+/H+ or K+/H+ antiporter (NhaP) [Fructobacillus sp. LMG 32999]CAK1252612.1 NhaP-type Na+/H+ or K+/H+ antiporter (NhaP) [Fructobacillus sp. LMG 32999]